MKQVFILLIITAALVGAGYGLYLDSMYLFFGSLIGALIGSVLINMGSYAQKDENRRKLGRRYID